MSQLKKRPIMSNKYNINRDLLRKENNNNK